MKAPLGVASDASEMVELDYLLSRLDCEQLKWSTTIITLSEL